MHSVSDTASLDSSKDQSGPTIRDILLQRECTSLELAIVPDVFSEIQNTIKKWCLLGNIDWIITTGGTGFGERDITPEVIQRMFASIL